MAEHVMKVSEEELQQMRRDREKMSEEFQHFLEVNLKKSSHDDNKSQIECEEQKVMHSLNVTQVARNLNESPRSPLHLSPRDGMKTPRGISSSSIRCAAGGAKAVKSVEEKKLCKKVKNYDPIETRRFMRDQQKKRQVELRKGELDDRTRKLEIQKRLNELQESTKRILGKSSGKKCGKTATSPKVARSLKLVDQDAIKGNDTTPRKSATYENVCETPKVPQDDLGVKSKIPQIPEIVEKMPQSPSKSVSEGKKVPEEKLEAPSHLKLSKGVKKKKTSNIPHWLKPTTVNIYPYDFITSVREKLDAISNAKLPEKQSIIKNPPKNVATDKWTDINRWTLQQEYNANRGRSYSHEDKSQFSGSHGEKKPPEKMKKKSEQKSTSDPLTNFSSMSIHVPDSNTISDISSIQSEIFPTSIRLSSTRITNQCERTSDGAKISPEVPPMMMKGMRDNNHLSPLSVGNTMRIMSPQVAVMKVNDGNEGGGKIGGNLSNDKFQPLDTSANKAEIHGGNLTDLLDAFNRSLSQVIQMNQQLYSVLNKSPNVTQLPQNAQQENAPKCLEAIPPDDVGTIKNSAEYEEDTFEEVNSTVKTIGEKVNDVMQVIERIDGSSEGVDKSGEIDLGPNVNLMDTKEVNSTIGSDIFAVFNQTDMEVSYVSSGGDEGRETSISYSNIGLFEQMIKTEKLKGDHLMTMIRMREKALIDRTRGQIAWLELQKKRFREKGRILEITAIRKKQRAILLKLERERGQLQKQLRMQNQPMYKKSPNHRVRVVEKTISNVVTLRRSSPMMMENRGALKGYEMEAGATLEKLLEQRELELQKRREHVGFLMQWHERLDKEEHDVREIEQKLLNCNLEKFAEKNIPAEIHEEHDAYKRVEEIDRSLQILSSIDEKNEENVVEVRGVKLNHLWKKLIGREENKFNPDDVYKMGREDFSQLYEEAKAIVLEEFHNEKHIKQLLEESQASVTRESLQHTEEEKKSEEDVEGYSTDDFESGTSMREKNVKDDESGQENAKESSAEEEVSKNSDEDISEQTNAQENHEEEILDTQEETFQDVSQEITTENTEITPKVVDVYFSPEILSQAEEEQLISDMTLPSFSETTILEEPTMDEIEVGEEQIQNANVDEKFLDSDLSLHSTSENLDKTPNISQESLNTLNDVESVPIESDNDEREVPSELEQRIIEVDVSLKDLSSTMEKSPILEVLSPSHSSSSSTSSEATLDTQATNEEQASDETQSSSYSQQKIRDYKIPNRMPDIISEAELLRRQQMQIEQEIKQLEQTVPAVFIREIPNKPPPPYVPPSQDSPLATIFPSEERVLDLVINRTKELFYSTSEVDKSDGYGITNVYEKIIIGMCEEMFGEIKETLDTQYDAPFQRVRLYKNKLCFYKPPDRLRCIQEHILDAIGQILPAGGNYPRIQATRSRKRDQIDEIVIEEMLEDDWKWSNFQIEETEVLDMMTETIFSTLLEDAIRDIDVAHTKKHN